jgi:uncharacterized lipoprotein YddW (UPF0748 family)
VADANGLGPLLVPATSLSSREAVQRAVSTAVEGGMQALLVPVGLFSEPPALLADVVASARAAGLRVVASVDITLTAGADELPASRDHVIYTHPEWLMVPRELALELSRLDVHSPDYVGRLARWTRANAARAGGLYLSPVHRDAAVFVADSLRRLMERFSFDGVQFETAGYPSSDFDYSRLTLDVLRHEVRAGLPANERRRMDGIEAFDALAYANEFPDDWQRLRRTQLTALVVRARTAAKSVRPDAVVSAVAAGDRLTALGDHLQDWATWLENRFVDAVSGGDADEPPTPEARQADGPR